MRASPVCSPLADLQRRARAEGRKLAAGLGVRAEFVRTSWGSVADDAAEGHVDVAMGMWPGPRRALVSRSPAPTFIALVNPQHFALPLSEPLARRSEIFLLARGDADVLSYLNTRIRFHDEGGCLPQRRAHRLGSLAWRSDL